MDPLCKRCGGQFRPNSRFCGSCGNARPQGRPSRWAGLLALVGVLLAVTWQIDSITAFVDSFVRGFQAAASQASPSSTVGTPADYTATGDPPEFKVQEQTRSDGYRYSTPHRSLLIANVAAQPIAIQSFLINHHDDVDGCDSTIRDPKAAEKAAAKDEADTYERVAACVQCQRSDRDCYLCGNLNSALDWERESHTEEARAERRKEATSEDLFKYGPLLPLQLAQGETLTLPEPDACGQTFIQIDIRTDRGNVAYGDKESLERLVRVRSSARAEAAQ
jgi:hypothetical protein